jgi:hypothetical protein
MNFMRNFKNNRKINFCFIHYKEKYLFFSLDIFAFLVSTTVYIATKIFEGEIKFSKDGITLSLRY